MRRAAVGGVPVPIYIEISSLHRTVTIVARGRISPDEIRGAARQMLEARVPHYSKLIDSKLIDVSGGTTEFTPEQVETLAALFRGSADRKLGAVAFLVDPERGAFARAAAATKEARERPVRLFTSLREAREWLASPHPVSTPSPAPAAAPAPVPPPDSKPWSDPQRQAVMIRGARRRDLPISRRG
jgi:hypothetical protein